MSAVLTEPTSLLGEPLQVQSQHRRWRVDEQLLAGITEHRLG